MLNDGLREKTQSIAIEVLLNECMGLGWGVCFFTMKFLFALNQPLNLKNRGKLQQ